MSGKQPAGQVLLKRRHVRLGRCAALVLICALLAGCALSGGGGDVSGSDGKYGDKKSEISSGDTTEAVQTEEDNNQPSAGEKTQSASAGASNPENSFAADSGAGKTGGAESSEPETEPMTEQQKTEKMIREYIQTLSLEDKVSGLFIITPEALTGYGQVTEAGATTREALENYPVAGIVYFASNIVDREQVQQMLAATKEFGSAYIGGDEKTEQVPEAGTDAAAEESEAAAPGAGTDGESEAAAPGAGTDGESEAAAAEAGTGTDASAEAAADAAPEDSEGPQKSGLVIPLFLAVDEEGGNVMRIGSSAIDVPYVGTMQSVGATGDPEAAYEAGNTIGEYLQMLGFNLDLAPDADVLVDPGNVTIGDRSFGTDPELCGQMVHRYIDGLHEHGIASCVKHFPGLGDTETDTHTGGAWSSRTIEDYRSTEFLSFKGGIDAGTEMVMISHLSNSELSGSDLPASLNKTIITDILRGELGYDGIVITDSLRMGAVSERFGSAEAAVMAVDAGVDILLMSADFYSARQGIIDAVNDGRISEERIDESLFRILCARAALARTPAGTAQETAEQMTGETAEETVEETAGETAEETTEETVEETTGETAEETAEDTTGETAGETAEETTEETAEETVEKTTEETVEKTREETAEQERSE